MKLDRFVFKHPGLYAWKTAFVGKVKRPIYKLLGEDFDEAWARLNAYRETLLKKHCTDRTVLDVGCGRGEALAEIGKYCSLRKSIGIDLSEQMVKEACSRYSNNAYCVASGTDLPFPSRSVDVVSFHWVFHHLTVSDSIKVFEEALRVARHVVLIQDSARFEGFPLWHLAGAYWRVVDGGAYYRTIPEWMNLFRQMNVDVLDYYPPKYIRTCIFVVRRQNT